MGPCSYCFARARVRAQCKITVNEAEAERVRDIFTSYLSLGSLNLLMADLRKRDIVTKIRTLKTGETVGGIPFTRGPLAKRGSSITTAISKSIARC
jgi:hypothetical protein